MGSSCTPTRYVRYQTLGSLFLKCHLIHEDTCFSLLDLRTGRQSKRRVCAVVPHAARLLGLVQMQSVRKLHVDERVCTRFAPSRSQSHACKERDSEQRCYCGVFVWRRRVQHLRSGRCAPAQPSALLQRLQHYARMHSSLYASWALRVGGYRLRDKHKMSSARLRTYRHVLSLLQVPQGKLRPQGTAALRSISSKILSRCHPLMQISPALLSSPLCC